MRQRNHEYYEVGTPLLEQAIVLSCINVKNESYKNYIIGQMENKNISNIALLSAQFIELEDLPQNLDNSKNISSCLNYLIKKFHDFNSDDMFDNILNNFHKYL